MVKVGEGWWSFEAQSQRGSAHRQRSASNSLGWCLGNEVLVVGGGLNSCLIVYIMRKRHNTDFIYQMFSEFKYEI